MSTELDEEDNQPIQIEYYVNIFLIDSDGNELQIVKNMPDVFCHVGDLLKKINYNAGTEIHIKFNKA